MNDPEGADDVLGVLARERSGVLFGYAFLVAGNRSAAEDLVQSAFVKVFSRLRQGFTPDDAERYVRRTILTLHLDEARRSSRWHAVRHLLPHREHADDDAPGVAAAADVHAALHTLTARQRACVVLRFYDDLTVRQIAERLGVSEGAVKRYLSTGVRRLGDLVGPADDAGVATEETDVQIVNRRGLS